MNKKILVGMAGLVALSMSGTASAFLIDNFDDPVGGMPPTNDFTIDVDSGTTTNSRIDTGLTGVVGGVRRVDATYVSGLAGSAGTVSPPGIYTHSSDAASQISSKLTWDNNGAGLGGIDITDGLLNPAFQFNILGIDQGNVDVAIIIDDLDSQDTVTASNLGVGLETVAFSLFTGIDFTKITSIMLQVTQNADASDLTLDIFDTTGDTPPSGVPVPAAVWLFGTGLLGLTGITRRKKA